MTILLPETLDEVIQPIFETLPLERAMRQLVVDGPTPHPRAAEQVAEAVAQPALAECPELVAGLWLYIDELDRSHAVSQGLDTPTGAYWHAIMHRREGDFSNAHYWFQRAAKHPAMEQIDLTGGGAGSGTAVAAYDPDALVRQVQSAHESGETDNPALVSAQCKEWKALFRWCVNQ
ncbi:MAG: hypothetical protein AAGG38_01455 [Planctomycetota bacterium]